MENISIQPYVWLENQGKELMENLKERLWQGGKAGQSCQRACWFKGELELLLSCL